MDHALLNSSVKDLLNELYSKGHDPDTAYVMLQIPFGEQMFAREICVEYYNHFQQSRTTLKRPANDSSQQLNNHKVARIGEVETLAGNIVGQSLEQAVTEASTLQAPAPNFSMDSMIDPAHNLNRAVLPTSSNVTSSNLLTGVDREFEDFINNQTSEGIDLESITNFIRENAKKNKERKEHETTYSIMPTGIFDDVVDWFVESAGEPARVQLLVYVCVDVIEIIAKNLDNVFIKFERKPNRTCEVSRPLAPIEIHRSDFVDLSVSTLIRIMQSKRWSNLCVGINRNCNFPLTQDHKTWKRFSDAIYSLRRAIDTIDIYKLYFIFNCMDEYHILTERQIRYHGFLCYIRE
ncbi:unnamed protein product [Caenorhabditis brenneri]